MSNEVFLTPRMPAGPGSSVNVVIKRETKRPLSKQALSDIDTWLTDLMNVREKILPVNFAGHEKKDSKWKRRKI